MSDRLTDGELSDLDVLAGEGYEAKPVAYIRRDTLRRLLSELRDLRAAARPFTKETR